MRYTVQQMTPFHCKRGPRGCQKCQQLRDEGEKWCVLQLFPGGSDPPVARPITEVTDGDTNYMSEFEFIACFATEQEALSRLAELR
ncbi:MAG: hypothetical protein ACXAE3_13415 [Candidatus Kariarchaeaceae archaeon]